MSKINPDVLKKLRESKNLSQAELANRAKFDAQTIWRLENDKQKRTRPRTTDRLARVLGVEPDVLTGDAPLGDVAPAPQKSSSTIELTVNTKNALYLISRRYNVSRTDVLELAPLLFCWAAEMSLRERRERLQKLEEALKAARALEHELPHLPAPNFTYSEEKMVAESESIALNDLFGSTIDEDQFLGAHYRPHAADTDNPFAKFLEKLADEISDVATFNALTPFEYPDYEVCRDHALDLVGGDETLAQRILDGTVDLADMPKELKGFPSRPEECAAWVKAKADEFITKHFGFQEQRK